MDKNILLAIRECTEAKSVIINESKLRMCVRRSKMLRRLAQYLSWKQWDAIILNRKRKEASIQRRKYDKRNAYLLYDQSVLSKSKMNVLYVPFVFFASRKCKTASFYYFIIPVVISLIVAVIIDTIIEVYNIKDEV